MKKSTKAIVPILILAVGALAMVGFLSLKSDPTRRPVEAQTKVVETMTVQLGDVQSEVAAYGRVTSSEPVELYGEASGTLEEGDVPFKPAQSFRKGDLLLKIDDRQTRLGLNSTKSDLMNALATVLPEIKVDFPQEYQVWQEYFNSCRFDRDIEPLPETDNPRIRLYLSRFNVYKLYFAVRDLEILLEKHRIVAPFDGSIASVAARVGSTARSGMLLGEIISLEELEVAVPVEAQNVDWIDRDEPVAFTSSEISGKWFGKIARMGSVIDTRTQTVDVFAVMDNGQTAALLSGAFLTVHFPGRLVDSAVAIPSRALYEGRYVYLIENDKLVQRDVQVLRRQTDQIIVRGGLNSGDVLVTEIMQGVVPGMPARTKGTGSTDGGRDA